jgi:hypothetical protein
MGKIWKVVLMLIKLIIQTALAASESLIKESYPRNHLRFFHLVFGERASGEEEVGDEVDGKVESLPCRGSLIIKPAKASS